MALVSAASADIPVEDTGEVVQRVGKSKSTGQLKAFIGDEWVVVADATPVDGGYKITRTPKLVEDTSTTKPISLLDSNLSAREILAGKAEEAPAKGKSTGRKMLEDTAAILDIAASTPAFVLGTSANISRATLDLLQGKSGKEAYGRGREVSDVIMKTLGNPIQKALGMTEEAQASTGAGQVMGKLGSKLEEGFNALEKKTGIASEGFATVFDSLMLVSPMAAKIGLAKAKEAYGNIKNKKSDINTESAKLSSWLEEQGVKSSPEQVQQSIVNYKTSERDISGALKKDIYGKEGVTTPRETLPPVDPVKEAMGIKYGMEMERQARANKYIKEAEATAGGVEAPRAEVTPEELGQTAPRIPVEAPPVEAIQYPTRVPEGPTDVPLEPTIQTPSRLGVKQKGSIDPELAKKLGIGAAAVTGAIVAGDEAGERLWNAVGAGAGMYALTKIPGMRARASEKAVDNLEYQVAKGILQDQTPKEVSQRLSRETPDVIKSAMKGSQYLDRKPNIPATKQEAADIVDFYHSNRIQKDLNLRTDSLVGMLSTRIGNESKELLRLTRNHERQILLRPHELMTKTDPFKEVLLKLPEQEKIASELFSGEFDKVRARLSEEERPLFEETVKVLDKLGDELVYKEIISGKIDNYWPRMVKDTEGLLSSFGRKQKVALQVLIDAANKKMIDSSGRPINKIEESIVIDNYMRGYPLKETKPGFAKERKIDVVTEEMLPFYEHPVESLHSYIHNAIVASEKATLFGKDIKYKTIEEMKVIDLEESIGGKLKTLLDEDKINKHQVPLLKELLMSRYGVGEKSPAKIIQHTRNLISASLLSNFYTAGRQLGDLGISFQINGFKPTLEAVAKKLSGKSEVSTKEFGLVDRISEEFASDLWSGKMLQWSFKKSGFTSMDIGSKDVFLNSTLNKARTPKGQDVIINKYKDTLKPEEIQTLLSDIQAKKKTDLVHEYLFNELNDIQPLTKLETTQFGLNNPNARIMYSLKSYMLKQGDWVRNNAYKDYIEGKKAKALKSLASYMLIMGSTQAGVNAAIEWAMGRDIDVEAFDIPASVFKMFGLNDYNVKKIGEGKLVDVASSIVLPPLKAAQDIMDLDVKSLKYVPLARPIYELGLGGKEEFAKKQEQKEKRDSISDLDKRLKEMDKQLKGM